MPISIQDIPLTQSLVTRPRGNIGLEVISILPGGKTETISDSEHGYFYESEVLAIVHRSKTAAQLYLWYGKTARTDGQTHKRVEELASRLKTEAVRTLRSPSRPCD